MGGLSIWFENNCFRINFRLFFLIFLSVLNNNLRYEIFIKKKNDCEFEKYIKNDFQIYEILYSKHF